MNKMPTYTYICSRCDNAFEKLLCLAEYDEPQDCPECGPAAGRARRIITPVGFVLKGDGWSGKNLKIKRQMLKRRGRLAGKEREQKHDAPGMTLAPNVEGQRVGSWAEAQRLAKSRGKNASSYDGIVRKERKESRA